MAARDVKLYLSLKQAIIDKVANPNLSSHTLEVDGALHSYDYDYIFQTARRVFPQKYNLGHSYLSDATNHRTPISNLQSEDLRKLNMEYAEDIVKGWGGVDQSQIKTSELDSVLIEYEKELTAPDEPDYLYQDLRQNAQPPPQESTPDQSSGSGDESLLPSFTAGAAASAPNKTVIIKDQPLTNRQKYGTKENYAQAKAEDANRRSLKAATLWDRRKRSGMSKDDWQRYKSDNQDERRDRARRIREQREEDKKKRALSLLRNKPTGSNILGDWATKKAAEWAGKKIAQSRLGQAVARNFIDPLKQALANSRVWQAIAPRIQPFINAYKTVKGILDWPGNWWSTNVTTPFQTWLKTASMDALKTGVSLARTGISNFVRALEEYWQTATGGATAAWTTIQGGWAYLTGFLAGGGGAIIVGFLAVIVGAFTLYFLQQKAFEDCGKPGTVNITKSAKKDAVNPGENIDFEITLNYTLNCGTAQIDSVEVRDPLPTGTTLVDNSTSASSVQIVDPLELNDPLLEDDPNLNPIIPAAPDNPNDVAAGGLKPTLENNTLIWKIGTMFPNQPIILNFSVTAPNSDTWVANQASVKYTETIRTAGGQLVSPGGDYPPTQDNCNGTYKLTSPYGNFGDPLCNFKKEDLYAQLQQLDPAEANYWFESLVRKESGYNPNAYNPGSTSGSGALGLFQMNPVGKGSTEYDAGNVAWPRQTTNAVNYNNFLTTLGRTWCYWEAAIERWPAICRR